MSDFVQLERGQEPPWRWMLAKQAAKRLGVDVDLVNGLAGSGKLRGARSAGKSGAPVYYVSAEDVDALFAEMGP